MKSGFVTRIPNVLFTLCFFIPIIQGAARHRCGPLIEECERMFLMLNGRNEWLESLDNIPTKLKKLFTLNKLLAHQPWLINADIIQVRKGLYLCQFVQVCLCKFFCFL